MGYSYGRNKNGNMALACDNCPTVEGVRKRACPYKVTTDSSRGPRHTLPYCPAPALCGPCYRAKGGLRGVHGQRCADGAASYQAEEDAKQARLDAGDLMVLAAWGDWQDTVPEGMAGVLFGRPGVKEYRLVPAGSYDPGRKSFLSDYPEATAWEPHA